MRSHAWPCPRRSAAAAGGLLTSRVETPSSTELPVSKERDEMTITAAQEATGDLG
jgi:hypothetical protein